MVEYRTSAEAVIIRGAAAPDQIRMLVSAPPDMAPAKLSEGAAIAQAPRRILGTA
jgi:hypothetical protein